jgi:hypothetical protein
MENYNVNIWPEQLPMGSPSRRPQALFYNHSQQLYMCVTYVAKRPRHIFELLMKKDMPINKLLELYALIIFSANFYSLHVLK